MINFICEALFEVNHLLVHFAKFPERFLGNLSTSPKFPGAICQPQSYFMPVRIYNICPAVTCSSTASPKASVMPFGLLLARMSLFTKGFRQLEGVNRGGGLNCNP